MEDTLCGPNGENCPELPAFSGEDYFDEKPIGCCYTKEQQDLWSKWVSLKNRVARLEGIYNELKDKGSSVNIQYKLNEKLKGPPGAPGPAGPDGPQGPQGEMATRTSTKIQNLRQQVQAPNAVLEEDQIAALKKQVSAEWAAIKDLRARLEESSKTAPNLPAPAVSKPAPTRTARKAPRKAATAATTAVKDSPVPSSAAAGDAASRLREDERRLAADMAAVSADERRLGIPAPASAVAPSPATAPATVAVAAESPEEADGALDLGTLGSVPSIPLTGETGRDEVAAPVVPAGAAAAAPLVAKATAPAPAPAAAGEEPLDDLPPLGSFDLARCGPALRRSRARARRARA